MSNSLIKRIDDWLGQSEKSNRLITSHFLDEGQYKVLSQYLGKKTSYSVSGGYPNARRVVVGFNGLPDERIACFVAYYRNSFLTLTHRDVYGSLMGLSIMPEMIGDLFVLEDKVVIYAMKDIERDIIQNLTKINRIELNFIISQEPYYQEQQYECFQKSVASLRLDSICSAIAKVSREKAKGLIVQKQVKLNHQVIEDVSALCQKGDIISIHRVGRFVFMGVLKNTKRDRLLVEYKQFI